MLLRLASGGEILGIAGPAGPASIVGRSPDTDGRGHSFVDPCVELAAGGDIDVPALTPTPTTTLALGLGLGAPCWVWLALVSSSAGPSSPMSRSSSPRSAPGSRRAVWFRQRVWRAIWRRHLASEQASDEKVAVVSWSETDTAPPRHKDKAKKQRAEMGAPRAP